MIRVEVTWDKEKFKELIRYIENVNFVELEADLANLAEDTVKNMKETIVDAKNSRGVAREDAKLEGALNWEEVKNVPGRELEIGIGNIDTLKKEAPHFELINSGGTYTTKKTHVKPTTYFSEPGSGFVTFKAGSTHKIYPNHYVELAMNFLEKEFDKILNNFSQKIFSGHEHGWGMGSGGAK